MVRDAYRFEGDVQGTTTLPDGVDILALVREGKLTARKDGARVELLTPDGRVVVVKKNLETLTESQMPEYVRVTLPDGSFALAEKGMEWALAKTTHMVYRPYVVDLICARVAEGGKLVDICKEPGMPDYATLCRWRRQNPEAALAIEQARRDRAELMRDLAVTVAEEAEESIDGSRLRVDTYMKAAALDNPAYAPGRSKVDVSVNAQPTMIVVHTGIDLSQKVDLPERTPDTLGEVRDVTENRGKIQDPVAVPGGGSKSSKTHGEKRGKG